MNCKDYEAKVMLAKINGEKLQSLDEIIVNCLRSQKGDVKREELIHLVNSETGINKEDLAKNINSNLARLEKDGLVKTGYKIGYWRIC